MTKNIFSIIVTYNGQKWIEKCLQSLLQSTYQQNIIVVDNNSIDGTVKIIKNQFPTVELIEQKANLGFGKANNIGINKAISKNADFIFLLNQDAWVMPNTIENLIHVAIKNDDFGILSPIHLNGDGSTIDSNFNSYLFYNAPDFYSDLFLNKLQENYISTFVNAAAWLITKKCFNTIGGFDPMFNHYGEDNDYINRMLDAGFQLVVVPSSVIFHDRPQNFTSNEKFNHNQIQFRALLAAKSKQPQKKHFLVRKIIANLFTLYFAFFGKNNILRNEIKIDLQTIKYIKILKQATK